MVNFMEKNCGNCIHSLDILSDLCCENIRKGPQNEFVSIISEDGDIKDFGTNCKFWEEDK